MATEQLYRECTNCDFENYHTVGDGTEQNPLRPCPGCDGTGFVPVDPPNVPAIVVAARAVDEDAWLSDDGSIVSVGTQYMDALREALASTVAPLTEEERAVIEEVVLFCMDRGDAFIPDLFAKLAELRPELAPYLGVGDA